MDTNAEETTVMNDNMPEQKDCGCVIRTYGEDSDYDLDSTACRFPAMQERVILLEEQLDDVRCQRDTIMRRHDEMQEWAEKAEAELARAQLENAQIKSGIVERVNEISAGWPEKAVLESVLKECRERLDALNEAWCDIHEWTEHLPACSLNGDAGLCNCGLYNCEQRGHAALIEAEGLIAKARRRALDVT